MSKGRRSWTEEEIQAAARLREQGFSAPRIAEALDRTPSSVYQKIKRLGLPAAEIRVSESVRNGKPFTAHTWKPWTEEELDYLRENVGTRMPNEMAQRLGRSTQAVRRRLCRMGLGGYLDNTDRMTATSVARMMGVHPQTVDRWIALGLTYRKKGMYLTIDQDKLIRWLEGNQDEWRADKVKDDTLLRMTPWWAEKRTKDLEEQKYRSTGRWTNEDVARLKALRHRGLYIQEIAPILGRSERSVRYKLNYISGYRQQSPKQRTSSNERRKKRNGVAEHDPRVRAAAHPEG